MTRSVKAAASIILFSLAGLIISGGCGLLTAPVSVPEAVASNSFFNLDLNIVDQDGKPLNDVLLSQTLNHIFWEPMAGQTETNEPKTRRVDSHVQVNEHGARLSLRFSKDGYDSAQYLIQAESPNDIQIDTTNQPYNPMRQAAKWTLSKGFPIVMIARATPEASLCIWNSIVSYADYPSAFVLELPKLWAPGTTIGNFNTIGPAFQGGGRTNVTLNAPNGNAPPAGPGGVAGGRGFRGRGGPVGGRIITLSTYADVSNPDALAPGTLYLTLVKEDPHPLNAHGDVDPLDINLPGRIALHVAGPDSGFIRIEARPGYPTIDIAGSAPTTGYSPELVIDRARLRQMRTNAKDIVQGCEYFFIKADGHYGKGCIAWNEQGTPSPFALTYTLWFDSEPNNTNLTSHEMR